jgi:S1-C subfamily serine protease
MDMEKLTKQQIVLVTLLVSFVTSIATGIVTVALMDQAPPGMTQTINRIVERTIEKVVTPPENTNSAAVITKETIVISEDDKIIESVDKNKNSVVRIYTNSKYSGDVAEHTFIGLGTVVSKDGLIATGDIFADQSGKYQVTLDSNKFYDVRILPKGENSRFYFIKIIQDEKNPVSFTPVIFTDSNKLKLGQTIIAWGGQNQNSVYTGIISSLGEAEPNSTSATTTVSKEIIAMNTNISLTDSISGGPLLNLNGDVIGIRVSSNMSDKYNYLPSNILEKEVLAVKAI